MKTNKINVLAIISVFVVIALAFVGCSDINIGTKKNEKSEKALSVYTEAVDKAKNEQNFSLKLTTSIHLKEMNCSMGIFNSILKKVINHRLGNIEDRVDNYTFFNGVLKTNSAIVPKNVVQPVNSEISDDLFDGVKTAQLYEKEDGSTVYFVIAEEQNSADKVMEVFTALAEKVGTDFSNYDIRQVYPEVDALAKYHSNFIDIMSVAPRIKELMDMNNNHEHSPEDTEFDFGEFGKTTRIENGVISLGDTSITAQMDSAGRLAKVYITAPIGIDVNVKIIRNSFKAVARFEIKQTYEFSYTD